MHMGGEGDIKHRFGRTLRAAAFCAGSLAFLLAGLCPARAGDVSIELDSGGRLLSIDAHNAGAIEILEKIQRIKPFKFETIDPNLDQTPIDLKISGSLQFILERILQGHNYLIYASVRTREIERVVVIGDGRTPSSEQVAQTANGELPTSLPAPLPTNLDGTSGAAVHPVILSGDLRAVAGPPDEQGDNATTSRRASMHGLTGSGARQGRR